MDADNIKQVGNLSKKVIEFAAAAVNLYIITSEQTRILNNLIKYEHLKDSFDKRTITKINHKATQAMLKMETIAYKAGQEHSS